jgi:PAS domain S-box-containing protein
MNIPSKRIIKAVLVAVGTGLAVYAAALLGQKLYLQQMDVPLVLPQSGIALALVYVFGWPAAVGVLFGNFTATYQHLAGTNALWIAVGIACVSVIHAKGCSFMLRRWVKSQPPETVSGVLFSILIYTVCAAGQSIMMQLVYTAGGIPIGETFWLGVGSNTSATLVGIYFFTPTIIGILVKYFDHPNFRTSIFFPLAAFMLGLSLLVFMYLRDEVQRTSADTFHRDFTEVSSILQESINFHDTQSIMAIKALFAASKSVERDEFNSFTKSFLQEYPDTIGLTWAQLVTAPERLTYEQAVRAEGFPTFQIVEPAGAGDLVPARQRDEYFPATYIEPFAQNYNNLGVDFAANLSAYAAIEKARDMNTAVFSSPLSINHQNIKTSAILMVVPIYQNGTPIATLAQRRANLQGVAIGEFNVDRLVARALAEVENHQLTYYFYDITDGDSAYFLLRYPEPDPAKIMYLENAPSPEELMVGNYMSTTLQMGNRRWLLIAQPGLEYTFTQHGSTSWVVFFGGLLLTAMFLVYTQSRQQAESKLARSEAEFRGLSEHAQAGIVRFSREGLLLYANQNFAQTLGFDSVEGLMKYSLFLLLRSTGFEKAITKLEPGKDLVNEEFIVVNSQGAEKRLLVSVSMLDHIYSATMVDVTDRVRAAEEIRQLSTVVTQAADAVIITDLDGNIEYVNPAFERNTGYTLAEIRGQNPRILKSGAQPQEFYEKLWQTILKGEVFTAEFTNLKKNGEELIELKTISPIRDADGKITHFVATGRNITDTKEAERALKAEQARNAALIANSADGIVVLGPNKKFIYGSPTAYKIFGYQAGDVTAVNPVKLTHPGDLPLVMKTLEIVRADPSQVLTIEYRSRGAGGEWHWIESTYRNLNDDPAIGGIVINFRDITARKNAEENLVVSEHQNRALADAIPDLLFRLKRDGTFIDYKVPPTMHLYIPPEAFMGRNIADVMPQELVKLFTDASERAFATNQPITYTYTLQQDIERTFEARAVANQDEQEVVLIVRDITEAILTQRALTESEEKYRLLSAELEQKVVERTAEVQDLYNNAPTGYHSLDADGYYCMINDTELAWLGYTREEVIGKMKTTDVMTPESIQDFLGIYPIFKERGWVKDLEFTYIRKDGSRFQVLVNSRAIYDQDGKFLMSRTTVFDNTEQKKAQLALEHSRDELNTANAALAKASRLKDEFLASMSHELRTPLTGILGLTEALQMETYGELNQKQRTALTNVENSGRHLLELINDILDLSKIEADKLELQLEQVSVSEICQASLQLSKGMAHQKHQSVSFTTSVPAAVVLADVRRFKQMVVNLLSNAIKFTPPDGQLGLEVTGSEEDHYVRLTVWDKGAGIKPDDLAKLFKPFTQLDSGLTRSQNGTGLGLSLVARLAELHGGSVSVESEFGTGSRFSINLPWEPESATQPVRGEVEKIRAFKTALVIEDVEIHQKQIIDYLTRLGLDCVPLRLGKGAVETAASYHPDVILLDIGLPDMPGEDVLTALKRDKRTAAIPIIIASVEEDPKRFKELGAAASLVKPFSIDNLKEELLKLASAGQELVFAAGSPGNLRVMLADDNEVILDTLADFLRTRSFQVVTAKNGQQMLDMLAEARPDIILTDVQMPVMDGLTAIREIRKLADPAMANLPIVAITALAMPGDKEMCLKAGANEYISKPIKLDRLAARINEIVAEARSGKTA